MLKTLRKTFVEEWAVTTVEFCSSGEIGLNSKYNKEK